MKKVYRILRILSILLSVTVAVILPIVAVIDVLYQRFISPPERKYIFLGTTNDYSDSLENPKNIKENSKDTPESSKNTPESPENTPENADDTSKNATTTRSNRPVYATSYIAGNVFYPKSYARALGFKIYTSTDVEDHFSITRQDGEHFIIVAPSTCALCYTDGKTTVLAVIHDERTPGQETEYQIATSHTTEVTSNAFLRDETEFIRHVAEGHGISKWQPTGCTLTISTYNTTATYYNDDFINPWPLLDLTAETTQYIAPIDSKAAP